MFAEEKKKHDPLQKQLDDNLTAQQGLMNQIIEANKEFVQTKSQVSQLGEREQAQSTHTENGLCWA